MTRLRLYSRPDCHLCDYALVLLEECAASTALETVNIEENADLLQRYDISIPVLQRMDTAAELYWPFDDDDLELFLEGIG